MNAKKNTVKKTQAQRAEETKAKVLLAACEIFGEKGYDHTLLEDIANATGLTVSPIYHHFGNKLELFASVTAFLEGRLIERLESVSQSTPQPDLKNCWAEFVKLCREPGFAQVVLIDSPHVLGKDRWKTSPVVVSAGNLLKAHGLQYLFASSEASPNGEKDKELIMRMLMAALSEAALMVGQDPDYDSEPMVNRVFQLLKI